MSQSKKLRPEMETVLSWIDEILMVELFAGSAAAT